MPRLGKTRLLLTFLFLTLAICAGALAFGQKASSQVAEPAARSTPDYGRLVVSPANINFPELNYATKKAKPPSETKPLTIENNGRGSNTLMVNVGPITGTGLSSFSITPGPGLFALVPGKAAALKFMVTYTPKADGRVTAEIAITSSDASGERGVTLHTVKLSGNAKGPIPSPSPTMTATATGTSGATATATSTSSTSPSATPTSSPGATDKNSANAPGVFISGKTVNVFVPEGSDSEGNTGTFQVVVESAASPLPSPTLITTDRVTSCTPAQSGQVVCSGQGGTVDLLPAAATSPTIQSISPLPNTVNYAGGDCIACGAMVDDVLNLGIISTGSGFYLLNLSNGTLGSTAIATATTADSLEVPGMDFGYDMMRHLILSANFQVTNLMNFASSEPHFQVINISTPASPVVYDLTNDQAFFRNPSRTCGGGAFSDDLPDTTALDTSLDIAYVSFHNKAACFGAPPDDIAIFDMSQATFNATTHQWTTPSMMIQSITGTALNGIDPISVETNSHLAMVSAGDNNIGVLQLPTAAGGNSASLAITDYVNALMPNDPDGVVWNGWGEPDGVATYVSPNTGKVIGVLMNNPAGGGGSTYLALIDMQALLNATRDTPPHQILGAIPAGIVTFVKIK